MRKHIQNWCRIYPITKKFEDAGAHAFGVDLIPRVRNRVLQPEFFKRADVRDLPFRDGTVDFVTSEANLAQEAGDLFFMNNPQTAAEVARVLKPGGLFFAFEEGLNLTHFENAGLKRVGGSDEYLQDWYVLQKPINPVEQL